MSPTSSAESRRALGGQAFLIVVIWRGRKGWGDVFLARISLLVWGEALFIVGYLERERTEDREKSQKTL